MTELALPTNAPTVPSADSPPSLKTYAIVVTALSGFGVALELMIRLAPRAELRPEALLGPIFLLASLLAVTWLLMAGFRNYAILRGIARGRYYVDYKSDHPPDWVERPARTFNNLMQAPTLFFVVCALMMITRELDSAQLWLAWMFAATRIVHAIIYVGWNHVPSRFGSWMCGMITLIAIWTRFAIQSCPQLG